MNPYTELFTSKTHLDGERRIAYRIAGDGPPLLLLHGFPQTNMMWHRIAPALAERYTVVAADLRGYGDSWHPPTDERHSPYSKRAMADDMVGLLAALGHDSFMVAGHDRGGRVAHRLARDHGDAVTRLAVLDIAPTAAMYGQTDMRFATAYYHWHAMCEDYRAAATIDLDHDAADADRKLTMPLLALWGEVGFVGGHYDVTAEWRKVAETVSGKAVPGGHYCAEEAPQETLAALTDFFG